MHLLQPSNRGPHNPASLLLQSNAVAGNVLPSPVRLSSVLTTVAPLGVLQVHFACMHACMYVCIRIYVYRRFMCMYVLCVYIRMYHV